MKKNILLTLVLTLVITGFLMAQVPNGSFETKTTVQSPVSILNWKSGHSSATPIYDNGDLGIKIFNYFAFSGSLISDTNTTDFDQAKGFPINGRPDSLYVWINFDITSGDTLLIRTKNRETQNPFGYGELKLTGKELTKKRYGLKIDYPAPGFADSGVIEFDLKVRSQQSNSKVSIFKVELTTAFGGPIPVPNSNLDEWIFKPLETVAQWATTSSTSALRGYYLDSLTEEITNDASLGNQALKINNVRLNGYTYGGSAMAIDVNASLDYQGTISIPKPMFAVSKKYAGLTLDYKYNKTNDNGIISLAMFKDGLRVAKTDYKLPKNGNGFSQGNLILDYGAFTGIPDSASIFIHASEQNLDPKDGSELIVDNIVFKETVSISNTLPNHIQLYPNPANTSFSVISNGATIENIEVLDAQGKTVLNTNHKLNDINITHLAKGIYFVNLTVDGQVYTQKLIKQ